MEDKDRIKNAFFDYVDGKLSADDLRSLLSEIQTAADERKDLLDAIGEVLDNPVAAEVQADDAVHDLLRVSFERIKSQISSESEPRKTISIAWKKWLSIAALLIAMVGLTVWWMSNQHSQHKELSLKEKPQIQPGAYGATLVLSDGRKIALENSDNGELAKDAGVKISKEADGQLLYTIESGAENALNTLFTKRGETYRVKLPDGSIVWLNAESKIQYNANFGMDNTRRISLEGEAYFEVAKDANRPFYVQLQNQEIKVLGTRFNVNSYTKESPIKTSLVEGKIRLNTASKSVEMTSGQQAILDQSGHLNIKQLGTDIDASIAWTRNKFVFDNEDIENVMRIVARWYDVEVVYEGKITNEKFSGALSRFSNIEDVLALFEATKMVKFQVVGRKIFVK
ncbi:DUF4974 domain-containing protein [Sphingobacterium sp. DK4209]|uniref:DUF4974 domain-containing protein n=1 Tax=Sphingobacterium zhuxiongii TaxID=2662364 RepID=A0A5Q0Q8Z7_9SPHI|nr:MULTISPECIES: FecR family protein [unclassified Sphingobacterium]MVZ65338.1 DUF4974 domain-containing protein [Sphingobacterium sp. DK4209]QGA26425.1 DUF4974 domain-containing protein [Sphingobacterium sp. dk4302]